MADSHTFYLERAAAAATAAGTATLDNVRERELRAEKTWLKLAYQAKAVVLRREKLERDKAKQRALEAMAQG